MKGVYIIEHYFHLTSHWPGLRNDVGTIATENLKTEVSIPEAMDGPGVGTNPDEMLLAAAATCYIITLAAMLDRSGLEKDDLTMDSVGIVDVENGVITYKKIIHKPRIFLKLDTTGKDEARAQRIAEKAEKSCMISRAIQGNVQVILEVTIVIEEG